MNECKVAGCRFKHVDARMESKRDLHVFVDGLAKKRGPKGDIPAVLSGVLAKAAHEAITARK